MHRKPPGLIFLAAMLILLPVYVTGYQVFAYFSLEQSGGLFAFLFRTLLGDAPLMSAMLLACCITGLGLFRVKRWAFYSFIALAACMVVLVIARAVLDQVWNIPGLILSGVMLVGGTYLLRRDLARPYLAVFPRGFRGGARRTISFQARLSGLPDGSGPVSGVLDARTLDLSPRGCFIPWDNVSEDRHNNLELKLELIFPDGDRIEMPAETVRVIPAEENRPTGLGIRFEASNRQRRIIRDRIRVYYSPRFSICTEIKVITERGDINGYTYNLSAQGAFVEQSEGELPRKDSRALAIIDLEREHLEIPVRISWLNEDLIPEKPRGFGVEFAGSRDMAKSLRAFVRRHGRKFSTMRW